MSDIADFAERLRHVIDDANWTPVWSSQEANEYMAAASERRGLFESLASNLIGAVIKPRLSALADCFPNATDVEVEPRFGCSCSFEHSSRYPADARVAFAIEHDVSYEKLAICYDARMMPTLVSFNQHDRTTYAFGAADEIKIGEWVERRLLEFLDAYLRIDCGGEEVGHYSAIDPVCGMRINRSDAVATAHYLGQEYFFCAPECLASFWKQPMSFVRARVM